MPSKKSNQNKPNGFVLYANEIKNQLLKEGHSIRNMPDLIAAATPKWQQLPDDEREYYKEKAKWEWDNRHTTGKFQSRSRNHFDNTGAPVTERVDLVRVMEVKREKERQEVFMSFLPERGVLDQKFYFVSFICLLEEPKFQPIEVAATEFSLLGGRERSFHRHLNPGPIPQGYRFKAQQHSDLTHKLPLTGKMQLGDDYTKIYDELFHFLSKGGRHIPPIHVKMSECERVEECLKWLATNAGRANHLKRVYELEGLMLDLDAHLRGEPQNLMQMKQPATDILNSSVFDYDQGSRCEFHEDETNETDTKHCALGQANRYCFCLADYFCTNHEIQITERHLPPKQNDVCYTVIPSKDAVKQRRQQQQQQMSPRFQNGGGGATWGGNSAGGYSTPGSSIGGSDDLAARVAEKLRLEENNRMMTHQQFVDEEEAAHIKEEEQKKRWAALRGSPNKQQNNAQPSNPPPAAFRGRGRGRGAAAIQNLRRPGEKASTSPTMEQPNSFSSNPSIRPPPGFSAGPPPGFSGPPIGRGRGTQLHIQQIDNVINSQDEQKWAGSTRAPSAAEAPRPPRAWMS